MTRRFHAVVVFGALLLASFSLYPFPAHAACVPPGSPGVDAIVCTGTDTEGVASDGGNDTVTVTSGALIMLDAAGIRNPKAFGVDAGDDRDSVFNAGAIVADALAVLTPVLVPPALPPVPPFSLVWNAVIKVGPEAKGIYGGAGNDTITNTGSVTATSTAVTLPALVPAPVEGIAKADVSSTADAKSTAIDGGDDNDSITNTGSLTVDAMASATGVNVTFAKIREDGKDAKSKLNGNVKASASATGLAGGAGDDTVTNLAAFDVTSTSSALAAGGSGVQAKGSAAASAASTSESNATAIDLGGDNDSLANHARITATAGSTATALDVAFGDKTDLPARGKVQVAADGSATAKSTAIGIAADGLGTQLEIEPELLTDDTSTTYRITVTPSAHATGDDNVTNDAEVGATATATTLAAGVGISIEGNAAAKVKSGTEATAAAIDLGGGDDTLTNTGKLTATTQSNANTLNVAVGTTPDPGIKDKIKGAFDSGNVAKSVATGIAADGVSIDAGHTIELITEDTRSTVRYTQSKAHASGNDNVTNHAEIGASATAVTLAAGVGVSVEGKASADVQSNADAAAAAIDLGSGDDALTNTGKLTSSAIADASALNVAVGAPNDSSGADDASRKNGSKSESAADGGATAKSSAIGISADGLTGDTQRGGRLAVEDSGPLFGYGLLLGYNQSETHALGDDAVTNAGDIETHASATARAAGVGVTVKGAASANSTSTTESAASAIDLGRGDDALTNTGKLTVTADSSSQALKVAVSTEGKAQSSDGLWNGGIKSEANATGIDAAGAQDSSTVVEVGVDDTGIHARYESKKGDIAIDPNDAEAGDTADGNDTIINYGEIDTRATATSSAFNVAVTSDGTASAVSHVEAKAESTGIRAGSGDDVIQNLVSDTDPVPGKMTVNAESHANAGKVAVSGKGAAVAADALWDGGTQSEANVVGIDGDGGATDTKLLTVGIGGNAPVEIVYEKKSTSASGNDTIVNEQAIEATSQATAPSLSVALEAKKGLAATVSDVEAEAGSAAIRGGDGDDDITNRGKLIANATATAAAANVSIAQQGAAIALDSVWNGGTAANATAVGIDGDGGDREKTATTSLTIDGNGVTVKHETTTEAARGNDVIDNAGQIDVLADADADSRSVAVTTKGLSAALSQSTARAEATAIRGGDGDDVIDNRGKLTSTAKAHAVAASVAVTVESGAAVAGNAVWDGGVKAVARAVGIDGDGGARKQNDILSIHAFGGDNGIDRESTTEHASGIDVINNSGQIDVFADASSPAVSVAINAGGTGLAAAVSTATAESQAAAIDAGRGNDTITNTGRLGATADALAVAVNGSAANQGVAIAANDSWDGGVNATATAKGIDAGAGDDRIDNAGEIEVNANATAPAVSGTIVATGAGASVSTATAETRATAIDAGPEANADDVINTGKLTARADALAASVNASFTNSGLAVAADAVWNGGTTAGAGAKGIDTGAGADAIDNQGQIEADAKANTNSVGVSVAVSGVAGAVTAATAKADAAAIDAGAGDDTVANHAWLKSTADATARGVSVSLTNSGIAVAGDAVWDGGITSEANAKGIDAGAGHDGIVNDGLIETRAEATSPNVAISVAVTGVAGSVSTSTARADAAGINTASDETSDAGDVVENNAKIDVDADATAFGLQLTGTLAGGAVAMDGIWDGGTTAEADAAGIRAGGFADVVINHGELDVFADADAPSISAAFALEGVAAAIAASTAESDAAGIDAGAGDDTITNTGKITATTNATAVTVSAAVTKFGVSAAGNNSWDGGASSEARSRGIDGGAGRDVIDNAGEVTAESTATSPSVSVAFTVAGVSAAVSTATAEADSSAIDGGDGDDRIDNQGTGKLTSKAHATGVAVNVTLAGGGVAVAADSVWDGGTHATATARGIDGGKGKDEIENQAAIEAEADSTTVSTSVSVTGVGVGGAISTSTSTANATAIDGGDGADALTNGGVLKAKTNASATGVAVTFTGGGVAFASDAFWDGGTKADANSIGMAGGAGDDTLWNTADLVTADATSDTHSVAVSVTGAGLAGAAAASTSTARATAIDGGTGQDGIANDGALVSNATSTAAGVSVTVAMQGGAVAGSLVDNVTKAEAIATGIAGGDNDDAISNSELSSITLTPKAEATDTAVAVTLTGIADADSQARAIARGTGIDGGDGNDSVTNSGAITGTLTAESKARAISVSLTGSSGSRASATAETFATGIEGGNNDDRLMNLGNISLTSKATARGQSIGVSLAGTTINDAKGTGRAAAVGLAGGAGDDTVTNNGSITLLPTAETFGQSVGISVAGAAVNDASAVSDASATGLDGGSGDDMLTNNETIKATVSSTATARSTGVVVAGSNLNKSNSTATAGTTGIHGQDDDDLIANNADAMIDVAATAKTVANAVTVTVAGSANGEAQTTPTATAVGLEGGAGDDEVINDGTIGVSATSDSTSTSSSTSVFGSSGTKAGTTALTAATGIGGGGGEDLLFNRGMLTTTASSTGTVNSSSWTLAGKASDESALKATARATGMAGGGDADRIRNEGDVLVDLSATLTATGGSKAIFGNATSDTQITAETDAIGIGGEAGADVIENAGNIDVSSTASLTSNKVTVSFAGSPSSNSVVVARSRSTGIDGGSEADRIRNDGSIAVSVSSDSSATGGARTTFGGTNTDGLATADATALGIEGGAGDDVITNARLIDVTAATDATTTNSSDSGWLTGDGDTRSQAATTVGVVGVSGGEGDNVIVNDDELKVGARGTGYTFAYASGAHLSFDGDGEALADSRATATATGISAGDGDNVIVNNKAITISSIATTVKTLTTTTNTCSQEIVTRQECHDEPDPDDPDKTIQVCVDVQETVTTCQEETITLSSNPTYAGANGNGIAGDGTATAKGTVDGDAYGIQAGDGDNLIVNNGEMSVTASPEAKATVFGDGDLAGDATGTATATARAKAFGIWAGDGNNEIANHGTLTVTAAPRAQARTEVSGGDICIWYLFGTWCGGGGSGIGTSTATFDAQAYGIRVGGGENLIVNDGNLKVTAAPAASDFTAGVFSADSATRRTHVTSRAVGILTGDNDNEIYNTEDGIIDVEARDVPIAYSCSGGGCTHSISAVGVQTGAGNDLIVNDGAINTSTPSGAGIGIQSGGGNDTVELGDGSSMVGGVDLGAGDDGLTFIGGARVTGLSNGPGSLNGGVDTDSLIFDGAGSFSGSIQNFENATKQGNGTFALSGLPTMQRLEVSRGTLQTGSAYSFAAGGSYEAWIYGGGDLGKLLVNGGSAALAGDLAVMKGNGAFIDGTHYSVVEATGGIDGATGFDNVILPAPTPLLQFSYAQLPNAAQVEANVASFTTVTTSSVGLAVAEYLDAVLPTATGDLSNVLGDIQGLPASEHESVYASLSPDTFSDISRGAAAGIQANTGSLQQRMQSVRLGDAASTARSTTFSDGKPVMLAYNGSAGRLGGLLGDAATGSRQGMYGLWVNAFGQKGDQESDAAHAGFNYNVAGVTLGFDHDFTPNMLAGVSLGYARTNLHLDRGLGDGDVNSTVLSAYGSYFDETGYIDGTLSLGGNRYANIRNILLMGSPRTASSYHDGKLLSVSVTGGYYFQLNDWTWEPFASLQYSSLDEDSFDETGAGAVSLNVDARRTQYLASDLGVRFRRALERSNGFLVPELSVAWNHDFDVDDRFVTASFAGSSNATFSVPGQEIERNGAKFGAGVSFVSKKGLTSSLRYGAEMRNDYTAQTVIGEIRYEFK